MTVTMLAGIGGALIVAGLIGLAIGLRPVPAQTGRPVRQRRPWGWTVRTQVLLALGGVAGVVIALSTGWLIALVLAPVAAAGIPALLISTEAKTQIGRLEAMEEWTRTLAGVLTVGIGLEQALVVTRGSTPKAIAEPVARLTVRIRAGRPTAEAIRVWADEIDDATGDLIAANLVLASTRRGDGLSAVLESLADAVAADVRFRRQIEAERQSARAAARWTTGCAVVALSLFALFSDLMRPYGTPLGQLILAVLLTGFAVMLWWMRQMTRPRRIPRFIGPSIAAAQGRTR